ncbi:hypothetical protein JOB18_015209 [Solea senegalensis]|uniref:Uncharacterized protein n=1 Tax=Solea senegalensis TaxID=28829 RepID=A0AAV6SRL9_SOLSE|nr:hypothetical protein JOB18_015209 [Solea senegalensis]
MGNKTGKLKSVSDPLTGPSKLMAEKWGKSVVDDVPLWHHLTEEVFPIIGTLSTDCLKRCRVLLEERKEKKVKKKIDWQVFEKWEREAALREAKSVAGLMLTQEIGEEGDKKKARQRRRAREVNLPPPYVLPVSAPPPPSETQAAGQSPAAESRNGSEEEKEEKPKLYPDLSTLPTPMRENKRTDNVSQPANIASSRNVSSPLAASFDYWLRSQREKGDAHQMPMLTFPNPQPRPTGEEEYVHWDPEVLVYRPWQPDELKEIAGELPDPQKTGGEKWVIAMQQLLTMYNPTLQEVEAVSRRCFKLRWANIRPANWSTSPVIGSGRFHDMMTSLADAVRAAFPLRVCWPEIHNTKQKEAAKLTEDTENINVCVCVGMGQTAEAFNIMYF